MKIGDKVEVVKMDRWKEYVGNLVGKKGRIIELLDNSKGGGAGS